MTDPEKLRALVGYTQHKPECGRSIASIRFGDADKGDCTCGLSTLLAEAEPSMGATMGDSMGNPDRTPHSATVYDFDKESRIACEAIGSPGGRMTVACGRRGTSHNRPRAR
jgi:hypothetical protein